MLANVALQAASDCRWAAVESGTGAVTSGACAGQAENQLMLLKNRAAARQLCWYGIKQTTPKAINTQGVGVGTTGCTQAKIATARATLTTVAPTITASKPWYKNWKLLAAVGVGVTAVGVGGYVDYRALR